MSILQEKNLSLHHFDLCPAMDLVAFLTHEGFICVHRTISWERVYVRKIEEVVQEKSDQPLTVTALKFSLDGKFLALGFSSGLVVLIDIEFSVTFQKTLASPVSSVTWQRFPVTSSKRSDVAESLELDELFEQESNDSHRPDDRQRCLRLLADSLLFVFLSDLTMVVLSYGVEIVYLTSLQSLLKLPTPPHHLALTPHLLSLSQQRRLVLSMSLTPSSAPDVIAASPSSSQRFLRHVEQLRRLSYISLLTSAHLRQLEEVVAGMARRWRECVKTIPAKISLLTSLLQGYELRLTPVEFLHSLTLCGLWHPAALTSFSSHWNEQGIVRMRASVDSTTKHVIRCLQFKILPALTSLFLLATEYVAICSLLRGEDEEATSEYRERLAYRESAWQSFSLEIVSLFLAYDRTLHEAKYVREAMLSFFQFVRDCFQEATSSSASSGDGVTPAASHTVDYVIREKCGVFFSPMSNRPAIQNAEYVTGSHLFAHLSFEGVTPAPPLRSCAPSDPNPDVIVQERISREKEALLQSLTHDLQQAFTTSEEVEGVSSEQAQLFLQHILASSTSSSSSLLFGQQVKKTVQLYAKSIEPFPLDLFTTAYDATSSPPTSFSTSSMSLASRVQSQRSTVLMTHFPFREEGVGLSRVRSDFALLRVCLSETSDVILQLLEKDAQRNEMRFAARVSLRHDSPDKQLKGVQLFLYDRTSSPSSEAQANEAEQQMRHFQVVVLEEVQGVQGEDRKLTVRKFSLADVTFTRLKGNETSEEVQKVVLVPASVTSEVLLHASCERVEGDVSSGRGILLLQQIPFSPTILSRVHVIDLEAEEEEDDEGEDEEEEVEEEEEDV